MTSSSGSRLCAEPTWPEAGLDAFGLEILLRERGEEVKHHRQNGDHVDAAAAVFDGTGQAVAAISVGAIRERIGDRFENMGDAVARAARLLSDAIGSQAPN